MPNTRNEVFDRVHVDYAIRGTARVSWSLRKTFRDPQPHIFQLQVNLNGGDEEAWENVGSPIMNGFFALDSGQRIYGKGMRVVYRVELTTPLALYYSPAATVLGDMHIRQWLLARNIIRMQLLQAKQRGLRVMDGYLLKRKTHGARCEDCIDKLTGGVTNTDCETCRGTGIVEGYWHAASHTMIDMTPDGSYSRIDDSLARGTVNPKVSKARFVGLPIVEAKDVWIEANSDRRHYIEAVSHENEINRVPIITSAELRQAEFTDIIYKIDLAGI